MYCPFADFGLAPCPAPYLLDVEKYLVEHIDNKSDPPYTLGTADVLSVCRNRDPKGLQSLFGFSVLTFIISDSYL